jgi:hypothetical protein
LGKRNEAKKLKRNEAKKLKRNEAKKLVPCFRLSMRKQSETDPVSLHFASKRKNILCETGDPTPIRVRFSPGFLQEQDFPGRNLI